MSSINYKVVITCASGLERVLADELAMICPDISCETGRGQLRTELPLKSIYSICLWSRIRSRVFIQLAAGRVNDADEMYDVAASINWSEHFGPEHTFAVDFKGLNQWMRHSNFGALKVKDAVVDKIREATGERPNVDIKDPAIRVYAHLGREEFSIGLDISGGGLHRRGYRQGGGLAPMRETLAAALLYKAQWPEAAKRGESLLDPMCGSGTLVIEAAYMATDTAPGMYRDHFGFEQWYGHQQAAWDEVYKAAEQRESAGRAAFTGRITGLDLSHKALQASQRAVSASRFGRFIKIHKHDALEPFEAEYDSEFLICNPPYGERVGDEAELAALYQGLAKNALALPSLHRFSIFSSRLDLCRYMPLRSPQKSRYYNGDIETYLLSFDTTSENSKAHVKTLPTEVITREELNDDAIMLYNRIKKNLKALKPWLKREQHECYRVYDADLPEFSVAIDRYGEHVVVSEYAAPAKIPEEKAQARFRVALTAVSAVFAIPVSELHLKERRRQKGKSQYRPERKSCQLKITEFGHPMKVELEAYLDTGLFLDHRPLRKRIMERAEGKSFLNLFCYTAVASLHAACAGAKTTSVDMSNTYLNWGKDNFLLNGLDIEEHEFIQANCVDWLARATGEYDMSMLDPPTFSNSKRIDEVFDVQRDHAQLIRNAAKLLKFGGVLYFSNNFRKFKLDSKLKDQFMVSEISPETIDKDFERNPKIHRCWEIRRG